LHLTIHSTTTSSTSSSSLPRRIIFLSRPFRWPRSTSLAVRDNLNRIKGFKTHHRGLLNLFSPHQEPMIFAGCPELFSPGSSQSRPLPYNSTPWPRPSSLPRRRTLIGSSKCRKLHSRNIRRKRSNICLNLGNIGTSTGLPPHFRGLLLQLCSGVVFVWEI
jgi:hypothetical protein